LNLLINAARIGNWGGLRRFAEALIGCFENSRNVTVVVPEGVRLEVRIPQETTPKWLASSSRVSSLRPILWWIYGATLFPARAGTKIVCTTHHALPFRKHQVVTVHDIRPYYYPDSWVQHFNFRFLLPRALRSCDGILTVSEATKGLLGSVYGLDAARVHVVPNTVDSQFFIPGQDRVQHVSPYLLCVGSSWKHKNTSELLKMHKFWARKYCVKIVAGAGQYLQFLKELCATLGIKDQVEFLTDVLPAEIRSLYQNASALVYPSLMEGFGLPPLEAMSCGRPVIVSDITLFRELYGEAPIFVQLGDATSWERAFVELDSIADARLHEGMLHARKFTQERMKACLFSALKSIWGADVMPGTEQ